MPSQEPGGLPRTPCAIQETASTLLFANSGHSQRLNEERRGTKVPLLTPGLPRSAMVICPCRRSCRVPQREQAGGEQQRRGGASCGDLGVPSGLFASPSSLPATRQASR